jgi:thioredoxin-like negative regulator of GroEL
MPMFQMLHLHKQMEICFVNFFKENIETTSPLRVISFYEAYKEYTPNSDEEVNIIKTVATTLMKLDLLEQSAALLTSAAKNKNSRYALIDFYLEAAQLHIDNKNGELALLTLNAIPQSGKDKRADKILLLKARSFASMGKLDTALKLLDEKSTVSSLKLAADLLIEKQDWEAARKRLFPLVLKLDDKEHKDVKADALQWLAMINILTDKIYDNQALMFVNKQFIS